MRADIKIYEETLLKVIKYLFKSRIFNLLTKKSSGLFLRGKDIISVNPQIFGIHEEPLTNLIKHYAKNGYKDFLIDIGANIGLTSCQNGIDFEEIHMYEANPLCCNILEVNANIALKSSQFNIHRYGLGESNKKCSLTVPKHNWGGAFIRDKDNSYNDNILASKDGFETIDSKNYFEIEIIIKDTEKELKELFRSLSQKGLNQGLIKIDVEGYEETILNGIANSIPSDMRFVIVFESWDNNFNLTKVINAFKGKCVAKKINRVVPWKKEWSKIRKLFSLLLKPTIHTNISDINYDNIIGDIILEIN